MYVQSLGGSGNVVVGMVNSYSVTNSALSSVFDNQSSNGPKTLDTTISETMQLSIQFGTANANNKITFENVIWEKLK